MQFPDPSLIKDGDIWYAFGTQSRYDFKDVKVQLATSQDFDTWIVTGNDALADLPPWANADDPQVWAPSVSRREDGKFLMYFAAVSGTGKFGSLHCVGTAVSDRIEGPYFSNQGEPFACPLDQGGALDASYFREGNKHYAIYKIDTNALGNGGSCNNGIEPILKTPIVIQEVEADGITKIGGPIEILNNDPIDGPLVEAPSMVKNRDGVFVLFFSSNCFTSDLYDVSYATSSSPTGPFTKSKLPLFVTGVKGLIGPGGGSIADDATHFAMHGYESRERVGNRRSMYVTTLNLSGESVFI